MTTPKQSACPSCNKPVELEWRICPHCDAVLQGPERGSRGGLGSVFQERILTYQDRWWCRFLAILGGILLVCLAVGVLSLLLQAFVGLSYSAALPLNVLAAVISAAVYLLFCKGTPVKDRTQCTIISSNLIAFLALMGAVLLVSFIVGCVILVILWAVS